jgi:hypothetical protein
MLGMSIKQMLTEYRLLIIKLLISVSDDAKERMYASHDSILAYVEQLESALEAEREKRRWISVDEGLPELDDTIPFEYCWTHFNGNVQEIVSCPYWCEIEFDGNIFYDMAFYEFKTQKWFGSENGTEHEVTVLRYHPMPPLPQPEEGEE